MKSLALNKKIRVINRNTLVSLHPMQLSEVGINAGDEVLVYVKGNKIIIEKVEVK